MVAWEPPRKGKIFKSVLVGLTFVYFWTNVAFANVPPGGFWQERKAAVQAVNKGESPQGLPSSSKEAAVLLAQVPRPNAALPDVTYFTKEILPTPIQEIPKPFSPQPSPPPLSSPHPTPSPRGRGERVIGQSHGERVAEGRVRGDLPDWIKKLPLAYVSVDEIHVVPDSKNSSGQPWVVLIQDVHGNAQAQRNIAHVLEVLSSQSLPPSVGEGQDGGKTAEQPLRSPHLNPPPQRGEENESRSPLVVGLEGASGPLALDFYRSIPDPEIKRSISDFLLSRSMIGGPEYAGIMSPHALKMWGAEDLPGYLENIRAFKDSVRWEKSLKNQIQSWNQVLAGLKKSLYPPALLELDAKRRLFEDGKLSTGEYLKLLAGRSLTRPSDTLSLKGEGWGEGNFPQIRAFLSALALEESLNFSEVEQQRNDLLVKLSKSISQEELQELLTLSLAYRLGQVTYGAYYRSLQVLCWSHGVVTSRWPAFDTYLRYLFATEKIQRKPLFEELIRLEKEVVEPYLVQSISPPPSVGEDQGGGAKSVLNRVIPPSQPSPTEGGRALALWELNQDVGLVEKLAHQNLTSLDWELYRSLKPRIHQIPQRFLALTKEKYGTGSRPSPSPLPTGEGNRFPHKVISFDTLLPVGEGLRMRGSEGGSDVSPRAIKLVGPEKDDQGRHSADGRSELSDPEDKHPADKSSLGLSDLGFQIGPGLSDLGLQPSFSLSYFGFQFGFHLCDSLLKPLFRHFQNHLLSLIFNLVDHFDQGVGTLVSQSITQDFRHSDNSHIPSLGSVSALHRIVEGNTYSLPRNVRNIKSFPQMLSTFESFYDAATRRNEALVKNTLRLGVRREALGNRTNVGLTPKSYRLSPIVLVAGGFHTQGIEPLFRQAGYNTIVLAPRLTKIDGNPSDYLQIFRRDRTPLDKVLLGEKLFLSAPLLTAKDLPEGFDPAVMQRLAALLWFGLELNKVSSEKWSQSSGIVRDILIQIKEHAQKHGVTSINQLQVLGDEMEFDRKENLTVVPIKINGVTLYLGFKWGEALEGWIQRAKELIKLEKELTNADAGTLTIGDHVVNFVVLGQKANQLDRAKKAVEPVLESVRNIGDRLTFLDRIDKIGLVLGIILWLTGMAPMAELPIPVMIGLYVLSGGLALYGGWRIARWAWPPYTDAESVKQGVDAYRKLIRSLPGEEAVIKNFRDMLADDFGYPAKPGSPSQLKIEDAIEVLRFILKGQQLSDLKAVHHYRNKSLFHPDGSQRFVYAYTIDLKNDQEIRFYAKGHDFYKYADYELYPAYKRVWYWIVVHYLRWKKNRELVWEAKAQNTAFSLGLSAQAKIVTIPEATILVQSALNGTPISNEDGEFMIPISRDSENRNLDPNAYFAVANALGKLHQYLCHGDLTGGANPIKIHGRLVYDIKKNHILFEKDAEAPYGYRVKFIDFGMAKRSWPWSRRFELNRLLDYFSNQYYPVATDGLSNAFSLRTQKDYKETFSSVYLAALGAGKSKNFIPASPGLLTVATPIIAMMTLKAGIPVIIPLVLLGVFAYQALGSEGRGYLGRLLGLRRTESGTLILVKRWFDKKHPMPRNYALLPPDQPEVFNEERIVFDPHGKPPQDWSKHKGDRRQVFKDTGVNWATQLRHRVEERGRKPLDRAIWEFFRDLYNWDSESSYEDVRPAMGGDGQPLRIHRKPLIQDGKIKVDKDRMVVLDGGQPVMETARRQDFKQGVLVETWEYLLERSKANPGFGQAVEKALRRVVRFHDEVPDWEAMIVVPDIEPMSGQFLDGNSPEAKEQKKEIGVLWMALAADGYVGFIHELEALNEQAYEQGQEAGGPRAQVATRLPSAASVFSKAYENAKIQPPALFSSGWLKAKLGEPLLVAPIWEFIFQLPVLLSSLYPTGPPLFVFVGLGVLGIAQSLLITWAKGPFTIRNILRNILVTFVLNGTPFFLLNTFDVFIPYQTLWINLTTAILFAWAHPNKTFWQRVVLFGVGFTLGGTLLIPNFLSIPLSMGVHSFYNRLILAARRRLESEKAKDRRSEEPASQRPAPDMTAIFQRVNDLRRMNDPDLLDGLARAFSREATPPSLSDEQVRVLIDGLRGQYDLARYTPGRIIVSRALASLLEYHAGIVTESSRAAISEALGDFLGFHNPTKADAQLDEVLGQIPGFRLRVGRTLGRNLDAPGGGHFRFGQAEFTLGPQPLHQYLVRVDESGRFELWDMRQESVQHGPVGELLIYLSFEKLQEMSQQKSVIMLGRDPGNDVVDNDPSVSRRHAQIFFSVQQSVITVWLRDLNSTHGTLVSGHEVRGDRSYPLLEIGKMPPPEVFQRGVWATLLGWLKGFQMAFLRFLAGLPLASVKDQNEGEGSPPEPTAPQSAAPPAPPELGGSGGTSSFPGLGLWAVVWRWPFALLKPIVGDAIAMRMVVTVGTLSESGLGLYLFSRAGEWGGVGLAVAFVLGFWPLVNTLIHWGGVWIKTGDQWATASTWNPQGTRKRFRRAVMAATVAACLSCFGFTADIVGADPWIVLSLVFLPHLLAGHLSPEWGKTPAKPLFQRRWRRNLAELFDRSRKERHERNARLANELKDRKFLDTLFGTYEDEPETWMMNDKAQVAAEIELNGLRGGDPGMEQTQNARATRWVLFDAANFGPINKGLDHASGDEMIRWVGRTIQAVAAERGVPFDKVFHLRGTLFAVLAPNEATASEISEGVMASFPQYVHVRFPFRVINGNSGTGIDREARESIETLMNYAAMEYAGLSGPVKEPTQSGTSASGFYYVSVVVPVALKDAFVQEARVALGELGTVVLSEPEQEQAMFLAAVQADSLGSEDSEQFKELQHRLKDKMDHKGSATSSNAPANDRPIFARPQLLTPAQLDLEAKQLELERRRRGALGTLGRWIADALDPEGRAEELKWKRRAERYLREMLTDSMTGLPNRMAFDLAEAALKRDRKQAENPELQQKAMRARISAFDLNNFKDVNRAGGRRLGNELIKKLASVLRNVVGNQRMVFRRGGDEFAARAPTKAESERINKEVENQFGQYKIARIRFKVDPRIGDEQLKQLKKALHGELGYIAALRPFGGFAGFVEKGRKEEAGTYYIGAAVRLSQETHFISEATKVLADHKRDVRLIECKIIPAVISVSGVQGQTWDEADVTLRGKKDSDKANQNDTAPGQTPSARPGNGIGPAVGLAQRPPFNVLAGAAISVVAILAVIFGPSLFDTSWSSMSWWVSVPLALASAWVIAVWSLGTALGWAAILGYGKVPENEQKRQLSRARFQSRWARPGASIKFLEDMPDKGGTGIAAFAAARSVREEKAIYVREAFAWDWGRWEWLKGLILPLILAKERIQLRVPQIPTSTTYLPQFFTHFLNLIFTETAGFLRMLIPVSRQPWSPTQLNEYFGGDVQGAFSGKGDAAELAYHRALGDVRAIPSEDLRAKAIQLLRDIRAYQDNYDLLQRSLVGPIAAYAMRIRESVRQDDVRTLFLFQRAFDEGALTDTDVAEAARRIDEKKPDRVDRLGGSAGPPLRGSIEKSIRHLVDELRGRGFNESSFAKILAMSSTKVITPHGFSTQEEHLTQQRRLISLDFERLILDKEAKGERKFIIYAIGLGSEPTEALQITDEFVRVLQELCREGKISGKPSDWEFKFVAMDATLGPREKAAIVFGRTMQRYKGRPDVPSIVMKVAGANSLDFDRLQRIREEEKEAADYILERHVSMSNKEVRLGTFSEPRNMEFGNMVAILYSYLTTRNAFLAFARSDGNSRYVVEPLSGLGDPGDKNASLVYLPPGAQLLTALDLDGNLSLDPLSLGNRGTGILLIENPEAMRNASLQDFLSSIQNQIARDQHLTSVENQESAAGPRAGRLLQGLPPEDEKQARQLEKFSHRQLPSEDQVAVLRAAAEKAGLNPEKVDSGLTSIAGYRELLISVHPYGLQAQRDRNQHLTSFLEHDGAYYALKTFREQSPEKQAPVVVLFDPHSDMFSGEWLDASTWANWALRDGLAKAVVQVFLTEGKLSFRLYTPNPGARLGFDGHPLEGDEFRRWIRENEVFLTIDADAFSLRGDIPGGYGEPGHLSSKEKIKERIDLLNSYFNEANKSPIKVVLAMSPGWLDQKMADEKWRRLWIETMWEVYEYDKSRNPPAPSRLANVLQTHWPWLNALVNVPVRIVNVVGIMIAHELLGHGLVSDRLPTLRAFVRAFQGRTDTESRGPPALLGIAGNLLFILLATPLLIFVIPNDLPTLAKVIIWYFFVGSSALTALWELWSFVFPRPEDDLVRAGVVKSKKRTDARLLEALGTLRSPAGKALTKIESALITVGEFVRENHLGSVEPREIIRSVRSQVPNSDREVQHAAVHALEEIVRNPFTLAAIDENDVAYIYRQLSRPIQEGVDEALVVILYEAEFPPEQAMEILAGLLRHLNKMLVDESLGRLIKDREDWAQLEVTRRLSHSDVDKAAGVVEEMVIKIHPRRLTAPFKNLCEHLLNLRIALKSNRGIQSARDSVRVSVDVINTGLKELRLPYQLVLESNDDVVIERISLFSPVRVLAWPIQKAISLLQRYKSVVALGSLLVLAGNGWTAVVEAARPMAMLAQNVTPPIGWVEMIHPWAWGVVGVGVVLAVGGLAYLIYRRVRAGVVKAAKSTESLDDYDRRILATINSKFPKLALTETEAKAILLNDLSDSSGRVTTLSDLHERMTRYRGVIQNLIRWQGSSDFILHVPEDRPLYRGIGDVRKGGRWSDNVEDGVDILMDLLINGQGTETTDYQEIFASHYVSTSWNGYFQPKTGIFLIVNPRLFNRSAANGRAFSGMGGDELVFFDRISPRDIEQIIVGEDLYRAWAIRLRSYPKPLRDVLEAKVTPMKLRKTWEAISHDFREANGWAWGHKAKGWMWFVRRLLSSEASLRRDKNYYLPELLKILRKKGYEPDPDTSFSRHSLLWNIRKVIKVGDETFLRDLERTLTKRVGYRRRWDRTSPDQIKDAVQEKLRRLTQPVTFVPSQVEPDQELVASAPSRLANPPGGATIPALVWLAERFGLGHQYIDNAWWIETALFGVLPALGLGVWAAGFAPLWVACLSGVLAALFFVLHLPFFVTKAYGEHLEITYGITLGLGLALWMSLWHAVGIVMSYEAGFGWHYLRWMAAPPLLLIPFMIGSVIILLVAWGLIFLEHDDINSRRSSVLSPRPLPVPLKAPVLLQPLPQGVVEPRIELSGDVFKSGEGEYYGGQSVDYSYKLSVGPTQFLIKISATLKAQLNSLYIIDSKADKTPDPEILRGLVLDGAESLKLSLDEGRLSIECRYQDSTRDRGRTFDLNPARPEPKPPQPTPPQVRRRPPSTPVPLPEDQTIHGRPEGPDDTRNIPSPDESINIRPGDSLYEQLGPEWQTIEALARDIRRPVSEKTFWDRTWKVLTAIFSPIRALISLIRKLFPVVALVSLLALAGVSSADVVETMRPVIVLSQDVPPPIGWVEMIHPGAWGAMGVVLAAGLTYLGHIPRTGYRGDRFAVDKIIQVVGPLPNPIDQFNPLVITRADLGLTGEENKLVPFLTSEELKQRVGSEEVGELALRLGREGADLKREKLSIVDALKRAIRRGASLKQLEEAFNLGHGIGRQERAGEGIKIPAEIPSAEANVVDISYLLANSFESGDPMREAIVRDLEMAYGKVNSDGKQHLVLVANRKFDEKDAIDILRKIGFQKPSIGPKGRIVLMNSDNYLTKDGFIDVQVLVGDVKAQLRIQDVQLMTDNPSRLINLAQAGIVRLIVILSNARDLEMTHDAILRALQDEKALEIQA